MAQIPGLDDFTEAELLGIQLAESELELIELLVAAREAKGWKPADLARELGVDRSTVTRFESGGTNPTMATINRYAEAVGAMISYTVQPWKVWQKETVSNRTDRLLREYSSVLTFANAPSSPETSLDAKAFFDGIFKRSGDGDVQIKFRSVVTS
ncbi:helix-turn-helix transcriptional regulator [Rhodococcus qingshengii]|uniref:helix-turn-helix domain-containing protein n=1 Tax=Rhodococcus qingshengii TaxID=334542 RepID=UPI00311C9DD6